MKRIITLFFAVLLFIACVPTPEEEIVINKVEGKLEETIGNAAPVEEYTVSDEGGTASAEASQPACTLKSALGVPEHLNDACSGVVYGGTMDVLIDADVDVPNVSAVPVCRVALGAFSAEEKERTAKSLLGDGPYIRRSNHRASAESNLRRYQAWLNALETKPYGANVDDTELREWLNDWIEAYQKSYRDMDDPVTETPWNGSFANADGRVTNADGHTFQWMETQSKFCQIGYQQEDNPWYLEEYYRLSPRTDAEREADAAARAFLKEMHTTDVQLKGVAVPDESWRIYFGTETGFDNGTVLLRYLPVYGGIPVYPWETYHGTDNGQQAANVDFDYNAEQESIYVVVENGAVTYVDWTCPVHVLGVENENVPLLPFEKILEIFKQQVFMNIYIGKDYLGNDTHTEMHITEIHFSYMRVRKPNEEGYWLLPVWDFRGYETKWADRIDSWWDDFSILTINAVDGSIIDRNVGY